MNVEYDNIAYEKDITEDNEFTDEIKNDVAEVLKGLELY